MDLKGTSVQVLEEREEGKGGRGDPKRRILNIY